MPDRDCSMEAAAPRSWPHGAHPQVRRVTRPAGEASPTRTPARRRRPHPAGGSVDRHAEDETPRDDHSRTPLIRPLRLKPPPPRRHQPSDRSPVGGLARASTRSAPTRREPRPRDPVDQDHRQGGGDRPRDPDGRPDHPRGTGHPGQGPRAGRQGDAPGPRRPDLPTRGGRLRLSRPRRDRQGSARRQRGQGGRRRHRVPERPRGARHQAGRHPRRRGGGGRRDRHGHRPRARSSPAATCRSSRRSSPCARPAPDPMGTART